MAVMFVSQCDHTLVEATLRAQQVSGMCACTRIDLYHVQMAFNYSYKRNNVHSIFISVHPNCSIYYNNYLIPFLPKQHSFHDRLWQHRYDRYVCRPSVIPTVWDQRGVQD